MARLWHIPVLVLLLGAGSGEVWAQPKKGGGQIKGRPMRPGRAALDNFNRLSPDEQRRLLERLPPERKRRLEERLEQQRRLSPGQRAELEQMYDNFRSMPPERQEEVRRLFRRMNTLEPERASLVRAELRALHSLNEDERRTRLNGDEFRNRFTRPEQQLLRDLSRQIPQP